MEVLDGKRFYDNFVIFLLSRLLFLCHSPGREWSCRLSFRLVSGWLSHRWSEQTREVSRKQEEVKQNRKTTLCLLLLKLSGEIARVQSRGSFWGFTKKKWSKISFLFAIIIVVESSQFTTSYSPKKKFSFALLFLHSPSTLGASSTIVETNRLGGSVKTSKRPANEVKFLIDYSHHHQASAEKRSSKKNTTHLIWNLLKASSVGAMFLMIRREPSTKSYSEHEQQKM